MSLEQAVIGVVAASIGSAAISAWVVHRRLSRQFNKKIRSLNETHRKHHEVVVDKLNASHALARKELERQRNETPRQAAVASAERNSNIARLEDQLSAAYAELDRLRLVVNGPAPERRDAPAHGFADTQPFESQKPVARR